MRTAQSSIGAALLFAMSAWGCADAATRDDQDDDATGDEPPEALVDGTADLGPVLADVLVLGIDRYPRKPGAVFAPPAEAGAGDSPFAVLAKLKNPGS